MLQTHRGVRASLLAAVLCASGNAQMLPVGNVLFSLSPQWRVAQTAESQGTRLVSLHHPQGTANLYVQPQAGLDLTTWVSRHANRTGTPQRQRTGALDWMQWHTSRTLPTAAGSGSVFVHHFGLEFRGRSHIGFVRAASAAQARDLANELMQGAQLIMKTSLTDATFPGRKYYVGWGAAAGRDPAMMHNEVKFDVLHTHDIFTQPWGGDYLGDKLIGPSQATARAVRSQWDKLRGVLKPEDMFLQYSSGHGHPSGLGIGLSYREMRDAALSFPAREVVVFIMACRSGGLVDAFDAVKSQWADWPQQGRSLFVMASSSVRQDSSTGPGRDPAEPGGPMGSAGSAFGHALWKALIGEADGFWDGIQDGFISLGEIRAYTRFRTQQIGRHLPQETGAYNPAVIMNRVPSAQWVAQFTGGTDSLSDDQVEQAVRRLNEELSFGAPIRTR